MSIHISSRLKLFNLVRISKNLHKNSVILNYRSCSTGIPIRKKREDYYFDKRVQGILKKITGLDYEKVFAPKKEKIVPDEFQFVTDKQLKEMMDAANAKANAKLQMPPVMDIREPIDEVLTKDPILQYYLQAKLVFIDTSSDKAARNRVITVREVDGTLRKADWDERFRMNQIFFPVEGRSLDTPKLFESPYFEKLLEEESYTFVLDAACVQFEPDDPEYHRVTHATYEHIKSRQKFDDLRSTRHFGPMAFYFAFNKDINPLLVDMLEKQLIGDAADLIRLLYILHSDLEASDKGLGNTDYVKDYIERNKSEKTAVLELTFQTFMEVQSNPKEVENASV